MATWAWIWSVWTGSISTARCPNLQVGGQVVSFLTWHLGFPIPSPAMLEKIGTAVPPLGDYVRRGQPYPGGPLRQGGPEDRGDAPLSGRAGRHGPVRGGRDRVGPGVPAGLRLHAERRAPTGSRGSASTRPTGGSPASTSISGMTTSGRRSSRSARTSRIRSRSGSTGTSGPSARPPRPGSGSPSWPTGSPACEDPAGLQAICDRLGPGAIQVFFQRWLAVLPLPLTDRRPGRRVLVGAVDAPDRGLPHHGLRRAPPRPRVLRGSRRRQPRPRPPRDRSN